MSVRQRAIIAALLSVSSAPALGEELPGAASLPAPIANVRPAIETVAAQKSYALLGRPSRLQQLLLQQTGQVSSSPPPLAEPALLISSQIVPIPNATEYASADRPDFFGTVSLPVGHTPLDRQWQRATRSSIAVRRGAWNGLLNQIRSQSRREQIEAINQWVNKRIAFGEDRQIHGQGDRWSSVAESMQRGRGDCEDYAIAKMQLLHAIGFADGDLYLTIVKDLVRQADHALLVVRLDDQFLVLDNNTNRVLQSGEVADYRPVFTYAAGKSWIHGYRTIPQKIEIAALDRPYPIAGTR